MHDSAFAGCCLSVLPAEASRFPQTVSPRFSFSTYSHVPEPIIVTALVSRVEPLLTSAAECDDVEALEQHDAVVAALLPRLQADRVAQRGVVRRLDDSAAHVRSILRLLDHLGRGPRRLRLRPGLAGESRRHHRRFANRVRLRILAPSSRPSRVPRA